MSIPPQNGRALCVWLEDGDEGWHNTTQGGMYGVTEGEAIDDYLFLHSFFSPLLRHAFYVPDNPDHFQLGKLTLLSQIPTHVVVLIT